MIHVLLVSEQRASLEALSYVLGREEPFSATHVESAADARRIAANDTIDAVVVGTDLADMSGIDFLQGFVKEQPFINCALASPLYPDEFHQQTEGLGIFMQLPVIPTVKDGHKLVDWLRRMAIEIPGPTRIEQ